jgi:uncharacterized protein YeaO (DUF488 family)
MKIYTCYYAKVGELIKNDIVPIGISHTLPRWAKPFVTSELKQLAPTRDMIGDMSDDEYLSKYKAILKKNDVQEIIKLCSVLGKQKNVALLCYEKPPEFCHRHLVAEWIEKQSGLVVKEWETPKPKATPTITQVRLIM